MTLQIRVTLMIVLKNNKLIKINKLKIWFNKEKLPHKKYNSLFKLLKKAYFPVLQASLQNNKSPKRWWRSQNLIVSNKMLSILESRINIYSINKMRNRFNKIENRNSNIIWKENLMSLGNYRRLSIKNFQKILRTRYWILN
jgi:hypothetical protein